MANITLDDWIVRVEEIPFGKPSFVYDTGWDDASISTNKFSPKETQNTLYPYLLYYYATYHPNSNLKTTLKKQPNETQQLFLKFLSNGMNEVILSLDLIAQPRKAKIPSNHIYYTYSHVKHCFVPKKPNKFPRSYEFLLPTFWVKNKIFKEHESFPRPDGTKGKFSPFEAHREAIFSAIWKSYCQIEAHATINHITFTEILFALGFLAEDTLIKPINKLDELALQEKILWINSSLHPEDCGGMGLSPERWDKGIPKNKEKIYDLRLLDAKDYLNTFFNKYNYLTMKNALELFLIKLFSDFGEDLVKNNKLTKCANCGEYFKYLKNKKYCSFHTEGKDCGKKARNKRYYLSLGAKGHQKILKRTKELRAVYKAKGIKK